jgi:hypothetical protein
VYIQNRGVKIKVAPHISNINLIIKNMPKLDGTGPMGQGPKTGRGMGNCDEGRGLGWGRGCGCGCGCGCGGGLFGRMFYTKEERDELLKDREAMLEKELKAVKEELAGK